MALFTGAFLAFFVDFIAFLSAFVWFSALHSCIIVKKLNSLKHLVRTTVAESHN